jgi:hypothetical protein
VLEDLPTIVVVPNPTTIDADRYIVNVHYLVAAAFVRFRPAAARANYVNLNVVYVP